MLHVLHLHLNISHHQTIAALGSLPFLPLLFLHPQLFFLSTKVIFPAHACASAFLGLQRCTACLQTGQCTFSSRMCSCGSMPTGSKVRTAPACALCNLHVHYVQSRQSHACSKPQNTINMPPQQLLQLSCLHHHVDDAGRHILLYLDLLVTGFHAAVVKACVIKPAQAQTACIAAWGSSACQTCIPSRCTR